MHDWSRREFLRGVGSLAVAGAASAGGAEKGAEAMDNERVCGPPTSDPRDLPARDRRLEVRTLNTPRTPPTFKSRPMWEARAEKLREQVPRGGGIVAAA